MAQYDDGARHRTVLGRAAAGGRSHRIAAIRG